ncbi:hypothetical protein Glove_306g14 [Diversispora epigaea]|uniref:Uncharacterized protein n=1 Tax=Diversispora epigaea TaxID=1348612 RepID=A0A397HTR7_9GLOM|nr:hypothetical protein Glove_306g14 [Diversispora epigaea]
MTEEEASAVNPLVESFLRHEVNRYQKKLKYQRKSWPMVKNSLYNTDMPDQETQTQDTVPICDHEEEINCHVKKELDSLSRQLLEYNEKTFGSLMQEITKQLEEQVNANNKLRSEIEQQKIKLYIAEKLLASLSNNKFKYTKLEQDRAMSITDTSEMLQSLYEETRFMYFKFEQDCTISLMHLSIMALHVSRLRCSSFGQYLTISIIDILLKP